MSATSTLSLPAPAKHAAGPTDGLDAALVAGLRAGDEAAYRTLVVTYGPRMLAVARRRLSSEEDAEDAVQSAFLLVFRFIDRFAGAARLSTWLHRIVVNCALMRIRSRDRHPELPLGGCGFEEESLPEPAAPVRLSPVDGIVARESRRRMLAAVDRLPSRDRAAVRIHSLAGLTLTETSKVLRRSRTHVQASLQSARPALLRSLACPLVSIPA
jgi:RNA polymerase sigma-70 factor, ECF subfamily